MNYLKESLQEFVMTLLEAKSFSENFKRDNPEALFSLGGNFEFTDEKLLEAMYVAEQFWLSENISEKVAFEKALKFYYFKNN